MRRTVVALTAVALAGASAVEPGTSSASRGRGDPTVIVVRADGGKGPAPTRLLGANHHFDGNGRGLWDARADRPVPEVVRKARRAGLQTMRFPGGTVANMYDWKRAIGPRTERGCQVVGPHGPGKPGHALTSGLAFGSDELMRFVRAVGARPNIMVPFITETPADAADWVEYMNGEAGTPGNPNGGRDWADVRATNGHPAPYGVRWWEIGNEQHHVHSRYWMSPDDGRALRQYAFGGTRLIESELLGKACVHRRRGVESSGGADQVFEVLYPPVAPSSLRVQVAGEAWRRVATLDTAGPRDRVFTLDAEHGRLRFGDGENGAIPPQGRTVRATYRSVHEGYFAFARRMNAVDPDIKVCSSWGHPDWNRLVGRRGYECLGSHAIVLFTKPGGGQGRWSGPLEGHQRFMVKTGSIRARVRELRASMPPATPLILTEFVTMHGDERAFPGWNSSVSHALYMASVWTHWLNMRIPWGNGDDFLWAGQRGVLGGRPSFTYTADAVTREALSPMFSHGGSVLRTHVVRNPVVRPGVTAPETYPRLVVGATRADGAVHLVVVNRHPFAALSARVRLDGRRARGGASVRTVAGRSFSSWNRPDSAPSVVLRKGTRHVGPTGFTHRFPAHSTTVFRIPLR